MVRDGSLPAGTDIDALDARMEAAWAERFSLADIKPGLALFQAGLMTLLTLPVLFWLVTVSVVSGFLYMIVSDPVSALPAMGQGVTMP
jgi:hypothetical protein